MGSNSRFVTRRLLKFSLSTQNLRSDICFNFNFRVANFPCLGAIVSFLVILPTLEYLISAHKNNASISNSSINILMDHDNRSTKIEETSHGESSSIFKFTPDLLHRNSIRYTVKEVPPNGAKHIPVSHGQALRLLRDNVVFLDEMLSILRMGLPGAQRAYFFETPAASHATIEQHAFEFVLIAAPILEDKVADPRQVLPSSLSGPLPLPSNRRW
jgi:hypothetical protein